MISLSLKLETLRNWRVWFNTLPHEKVIIWLAIIFAVASSAYAYTHDLIILYGDAESHLNIAKRVVESLTPGFAQLGGIWLPLPHIMLLPFVYVNFLWRSGLSGSIVSGFAFVVTCLYLYRISFLLTKNKGVAFMASLLAMINPNMLYFQTTPMTELPLIMFFALSSYYFIQFLYNEDKHGYLIAAALFGFCATITRYDGWFLVGVEAGLLGLKYFPWTQFPKVWADVRLGFNKDKWEKLQGALMLFVVLAFFGVGLWLLWNKLILGDALYFTNSEFSAKSQQNAFLQGGMLPAYHHLGASILYYFVTSMSNVGVIIYFISIVGFIYYLCNKEDKNRFYIGILLSIIFVFNVFTMYVGQSVIFIPSLTPKSFGNNLFNVRYGLLMIPFAATFFSYLYFKSRGWARVLLLVAIPAQLALYAIGYSNIITLQDGRSGVSSAARPEAERWMKKNYDGGLVLLDDYARTISIVRSGIPMQEMIYVGNKPYWAESLEEPEKYAAWIAMREHDALWKELYLKPEIKDRLYANFDLVYTEKDILIFKRNEVVPAGK